MIASNEAIDTKEKMWKAIHNKRKQMKDNTKTITERVYCDTAIREFKKIEDFLESLRSSQEDVIEKKRKCDWNEEKHGHPCPYCEKGRD